MTPHDIYNAMANIVLEKKADCKKRLENTSHKIRAERKALMVEDGMYTLCLNAGLLYNTDNRETAIYTRRKQLTSLLKRYPKMYEIFMMSNEEDQLNITAALGPEMFLRDQIYDSYIRELESAKTSNDTESLFELKIKIGVLESVFAAWDVWREENEICAGTIKKFFVSGEKYSFYREAFGMISEEIERLDSFTSQLDKAPNEKKERIAEYKCAKYRYAAISNIQSMIYHSHRLSHKLTSTHHLLLPVDEILKKRPELLDACESAPVGEEEDYGLYYGMVAFTDELLSECEEKLPNATEWEKIELSERISGYKYSKECLYEAWKKKGVTSK